MSLGLAAFNAGGIGGGAGGDGMDLKAAHGAAHCVAGRPRLEQRAPRRDEAEFARAGAGGDDERGRRGGRRSERVALGALQDGLHGGQTVQMRAKW